MRHLGIDQWLIAALAPVLEPMTANPARFLVVLGLMIFAARFILPSIPLVSVLIITVIPIAAEANIDPLVLTLVICTTTAVWFLAVSEHAPSRALLRDEGKGVLAQSGSASSLPGVMRQRTSPRSSSRCPGWWMLGLLP